MASAGSGMFSQFLQESLELLIYRDVTATTSAGTVATAMIAYVGSETGDATYNHGLAIALSDEAKTMSLQEARNIRACLVF